MKLSPVVELACQVAGMETTLVERPCIDPEQLLAGMTKLRQLCAGPQVQEAQAQGIDTKALKADLEFVADLLISEGIDPDAVRRELRRRVESTGHKHQKGTVIHRSERCLALFEAAEQTARQMGLPELTVAPLFVAILEEEDSLGRRVLVEHGADVGRLIDKTYEHVYSMLGPLPKGVCRDVTGPMVPSGTPWLDRWGDDWTEKARKGLLGPVIGRREEIVRVLQTLARRPKRHPVLVGRPGTGRTAVLQALAVRAARNKAAEISEAERIVALDASALTGTGPSAEKRLLSLVEECRANPHVLLCVPQLHALIDPRAECAGVFRTALARGDLRCIAVATPQEYARGIESDPVMSRLFEPISVLEPSRSGTLDILTALRPRWEQDERIVVPDEVLSAAVDLSLRFDLTRSLPGKAVEALDQACARMFVPDLTRPVTESDRTSSQRRTPPRPESPRAVTTDVLVQVLSERTGIAPEAIASHAYEAGTSGSYMEKMEAFLKARIAGQDDAIREVCERLATAHGTLGERRGPLGVFLFLGPSGAGKTTLARGLAGFLHRGAEGLARFDMSAYSDAISASRFLGPARDDDGDSREGLLACRLRQMPYLVVLLENIEVSHPSVLAGLLRVFEEGRLDDGDRGDVDTRLAVFILESDVDSPDERGMPHSPVMRQWWSRFPASFPTYIDEQVVFKPLGPQHVGQIIVRRLDQIGKEFTARHQCPVQHLPSAVDWLVAHACGEEHRIQDLERVLHRLVEIPLAALAQSTSLRSCASVTISADGGQLRVEPFSGAVPTV